MVLIPNFTRKACSSQLSDISWVLGSTYKTIRYNPTHSLLLPSADVIKNKRRLSFSCRVYCTTNIRCMVVLYLCLQHATTVGKALDYLAQIKQAKARPNRHYQ